MDMQFNFKGDPVGGIITDYLLEKSRVVHQAPGERNFHIFYQFLRGADSGLLKSFNLSSDPSKYFYLNQSGCDTVSTINDRGNVIITHAGLLPFSRFNGFFLMFFLSRSCS